MKHFTANKWFYLFAISLSLSCVTCEKRYCNDGLGECTPYQSCSNSTVFSDGRDHINVRFNLELETDHCHYLEMCCDPEDVIEAPFFPEHGSTDQERNTRIDRDSAKPDEELDTCTSSTHECIPFFYCDEDFTTDGAGVLSSRVNIDPCPIKSHVCCNKNDNIVRMKPSQCGFHNVDGVGYDVVNNVDEAEFGEFPWQAALSELDYNGTSKYICGGSLIHPSVVLTGAHCVNGKRAADLKVRLGEWDTQTTNEILPHSNHEVSEIIMHQDFGSANLYNDIALLVLKTPVELAVHINTICLPPQNFKFDRSLCFASGWGKDKFGYEENYRVNLKKVELPVVPLRECQDNLRTTQLGPRFKIHTSFMCAGGERDVDVCTGDGGSPLVCPIPGQQDFFYQAGIVAWGIECGQEGIPGVYANVAKYRNWIDSKMNSLGYGTKSYTPKNL